MDFFQTYLVQRLDTEWYTIDPEGENSLDILRRDIFRIHLHGDLDTWLSIKRKTLQYLSDLIMR